jgi:hypothetical protein
MRKHYFLFKTEHSLYIDLESWKLLPFICYDKSPCTRSYELNVGFLCFNFRFTLKQNPNK